VSIESIDFDPRYSYGNYTVVSPDSSRDDLDYIRNVLQEREIDVLIPGDWQDAIYFSEIELTSRWSDEQSQYILGSKLNDKESTDGIAVVWKFSPLGY
jgi:hypothetical protein